MRETRTAHRPCRSSQRGQHMRKELAVIALTLWALGARSAVAQTQSCAAVGQSPVAWWPADQSSVDVIGGDDGTLIGGATYATGEVHQAFSFDGSTGYVRVADAPALDPTAAITITAWINPTS